MTRYYYRFLGFKRMENQLHSCDSEYQHRKNLQVLQYKGLRKLPFIKHFICLLIFVGLDKLVNFLNYSPLCKHIIVPWLLLDFLLLFSGFLLLMYFCVAFFVFILLGPSWAPLFCALIFLTGSGENVAIVSSNMFPCPPGPGTPVSVSEAFSCCPLGHSRSAPLLPLLLSGSFLWPVSMHTCLFFPPCV